MTSKYRDTEIRAPRGTTLTAKSWLTEAPMRMLMNNLHPDVAENPHELVVYGGIGRAARTWKDFDLIVDSLKKLETDETLLVQSGKPVGIFPTHPDAPRVLLANSNLVPAWAFSFGGEKQRGQEAQPLIKDGVLYITGSYSRVFALDAKTGKRLWSYAHRLPDDIRPCCDVVNRGAAIYGDKIYFGTLDARVVALNKDTGKVVWNKKFGDHGAGYTMTGAPTLVKDGKTGKVLLIHGSSGDEFGIVGKLFARDPDTGEEIWMRPFVEGHMGRLNGKDSTPTGDIKAPSWPDDPNHPTGKKEAWSQGGGAPWQSATLQPRPTATAVRAAAPVPRQWPRCR